MKNKPLLLEFVSENCVWCKKLETTTLHDSAVTALLNQYYVPIKIDAQHEAELIQRLQIASYPTLLLAAPDGRILTIVEGFVEAEKLMPHLQSGVATCQPAIRAPDIQKAKRAQELFAQAKSEFDARDYFSSLEKCQRLIASFADCPEAAAAARIEAEITANPTILAQTCNSANDRLTAMYLSLADVWMKKGKPDEAAACLEKVQQLSPGSANAQTAIGKLTSMQRKISAPVECRKP